MADQYLIYSGGGGGSSTVTANQGTPNSINNAWPVKVTDGTNVAAVKAASTAAQVTDPAEVVSLSPNSPLPAGSNALGSVTVTGTTTITGTVNQGTAAVTANAWPTKVTDGTNVATVVPAATPAGGPDSALVVALSPNTQLPNGANTIGFVSQAGAWEVRQGPVGSAAVGTAWYNRITDGTNIAAVSVTGALKVDGSSVTQPVAGTVNVTQGTSPWVENISQFGGSNVVTGTGVSGAGIPRVTVSSDSFPATQPVSGTVAVSNIAAISGRSSVALIRNIYSSVNVTTAAYVQLIASTASPINKIQIFDSSGQTLALAFGAAASEVDKIFIFPGGNGDVDLFIPAATRVSIIAISANATVGELDINFLS